MPLKSKGNPNFISRIISFNSIAMKSGIPIFFIAKKNNNKIEINILKNNNNNFFKKNYNN